MISPKECRGIESKGCGASRDVERQSEAQNEAPLRSSELAAPAPDWPGRASRVPMAATATRADAQRRLVTAPCARMAAASVPHRHRGRHRTHSKRASSRREGWRRARRFDFDLGPAPRRGQLGRLRHSSADRGLRRQRFGTRPLGPVSGATRPSLRRAGSVAANGASRGSPFANRYHAREPTSNHPHSRATQGANKLSLRQSTTLRTIIIVVDDTGAEIGYHLARRLQEPTGGLVVQVSGGALTPKMRRPPQRQ